MMYGPLRNVTTFKGYITNGYRFHPMDKDTLTTSNSGVLVKGSCYNDGDRDWYGQLLEIISLRYRRNHLVTLFRCQWFNIDSGVKVDKRGMVKVNVMSNLNSYEPFVLASQASQVYYARGIDSSKDINWYTVIITKARGFQGTTAVIDDEPLQDEEQLLLVSNTTDADIIEISELHVNLEISDNEDQQCDSASDDEENDEDVFSHDDDYETGFENID